MWAALPGGAAAAAHYLVQRWPSADMPFPGQPGYLDSLLRLEFAMNAGEGTFTATDTLAPAAAASGRAQALHYRVLALGSGGEVLAATRPSSPAISKGEWG